jgi:hypothetical protein
MTGFRSRIRVALYGVAVVVLAGLAGWLWIPTAKALDITVYKSPYCGCCTQWEDHLRENGFNVKSEPVSDLVPIKAKYGVTQQLAACHTAVVEGYVVEGHVPADLIKRLVQEKPQVAGLAVPGMPQGSPEMEQGLKEPYDVLTFDANGNTAVYAHR